MSSDFRPCTTCGSGTRSRCSTGSGTTFWSCDNPGCDSNTKRFAAPRAGSLQRRNDGGFNEYHGHGHHRSDGGITFDDSHGKHSHTVRDKDFKPVWDRKEGES